MAKSLHHPWVNFEARSVALFAAVAIAAMGATQQANSQSQRQVMGAQHSTTKLQPTRIQPNAQRLPRRQD